MRALLVLLLLPLVLTASAGASMAGWSGGGWGLFAVEETPHLEVLMSVWLAGTPGALGIYTFDDDGRSAGAFVYQWDEEGALASLDHGAAPTVEVDALPTALGSGFSLLLRGFAPSVRQVAVWTAGGADATDVEVSSESGSVALLATGGSTFYSQGGDMSSDAHAIVRVGPAAAALQTAGELDLDVRSRFIGAIGVEGAGLGAGDQRISLDTPDGPRECPCYVEDLEGDGALPSGAYTIRRESLRMEASPTLVVAGADIGGG